MQISKVRDEPAVAAAKEKNEKIMKLVFCIVILIYKIASAWCLNNKTEVTTLPDGFYTSGVGVHRAIETHIASGIEL